MNKKYEFTGETIDWHGHTLRQIMRISDKLVGGWIESEENLSHNGECFVFDNAKVYDNANISDNAEISGNAEVHGTAKVFEDAIVFGNAEVCGNATICGNTAFFFGKAPKEGH